jgi:hypothetical protein
MSPFEEIDDDLPGGRRLHVVVADGRAVSGCSPQRRDAMLAPRGSTMRRRGWIDARRIESGSVSAIARPHRGSGDAEPGERALRPCRRKFPRRFLAVVVAATRGGWNSLSEFQIRALRLAWLAASKRERGRAFRALDVLQVAETAEAQPQAVVSFYSE